MSIRDLAPWNWGKKEVRLPVQRGANGDPFEALRSEMNHVFDGFFRDFGLAPWGQFRDVLGDGVSPRVDIAENENEVQVKAELPGLSEKEVEVSLAGGVLVLKGEKKQETQEKRGDRQYRECTYGSFHREIQLPCEVQDDKAEAAFKNGLLTIRIPKTAEAKRKTHKIQVKQG